MRSVLGCTAEEIRKRVRGAARPGHLRWVFNLSTKISGSRELRFLAYEIADPKKAALLTPEKVIDLILPLTRNSFGTTDILLQFTLSRQSAWRLVKKLGKRNSAGDWRVQRVALANFLRRRWVGGNGR